MKKIEITKIGKMILELIIVLALFIITFYFVSGYHRKEFNSKYRESKISNNGFDYENEENKLTTYPIVGIILFSFYYLVWYIESIYSIFICNYRR